MKMKIKVVAKDRIELSGDDGRTTTTLQPRNKIGGFTFEDLVARDGEVVEIVRVRIVNATRQYAGRAFVIGGAPPTSKMPKPR